MQKKTGSYRFNFSKTLPLFSLREFFFSLCVFLSPSLFSLPHLPIEAVSRFSSLSSLTLFLFHEGSVINWLIRFRYLSFHSPFISLSFSTSVVACLIPHYTSLFSTLHFLLDPFSPIYSVLSFNSSLV